MNTVLSHCVMKEFSSLETMASHFENHMSKVVIQKVCQYCEKKDSDCYAKSCHWLVKSMEYLLSVGDRHDTGHLWFTDKTTIPGTPSSVVKTPATPPLLRVKWGLLCRILCWSVQSTTMLVVPSLGEEVGKTTRMRKWRRWPILPNWRGPKPEKKWRIC